MGFSWNFITKEIFKFLFLGLMRENIMFYAVNGFECFLYFNLFEYLFKFVKKFKFFLKKIKKLAFWI